MSHLPIEDQRHLDAAQEFLALCNYAKAHSEMEAISLDSQSHPDVAATRCRLYAAAGNWELAARPDDPSGWIQEAYALHALKRTQEAWDLLRPVVDRFPDDYVMRYNLACYACQLGKLDEARDWLRKAAEIAGSGQIREFALKDPDLEPLRKEIAGLEGWNIGAKTTRRSRRTHMNDGTNTELPRQDSEAV